MNVKNKQIERSQQTRTKLLQVGRRLFAERGYSSVSTEELVERAELTRGALYHHFKEGKQELFMAILESIEAELASDIASAIAECDDPWDALKVGCEAFLEACLERDVQRIALVDAPAVIGWEEWRDLNSRYCLGLVQTALEAVIDESVFAGQAVRPVAHLVLGAIDEAAMLVARADDVEKTKAEVSRALAQLIDVMRANR